MKISARNQLKGTIVDIKEGMVNAKVTIELKGGDTISSVITMASVKELGLEVGKEACAIIKSSSVMVGVE